MQQEQKFKAWLIKHGLSETGAATSYSRAIPCISQHYSDKTGTSTDIYSITDQDKINRLVRDYSSRESFQSLAMNNMGDSERP